MNSLKINQLYEYPELYSLLYGQKPADVITDVEGASIITERWLLDNKKSLDFDVAKGLFHSGRGLAVCELFAGAVSKHQRPFLTACAATVYDWIVLDLIDGEPFDITKQAIPDFGSVYETPLAKYDMVAAFYYSAGIIIENDRAISRKGMQRVFHNVASGLRKNGLFILDMSDDPSTSLYGSLLSEDNSSGQEVTIYNGHPLRRKLNMPLIGGDARVVWNPKSAIKRSEALMLCHIQDSIKIFYGKKLIQEVFVSLPFTQRMWTESELCEFAQEAGFKEDHYSLSQYEDGNATNFDLNPNYQSLASDTCSESIHLQPRKLGFVKL
jgi:hypothetical protein